MYRLHEKQLTIAQTQSKTNKKELTLCKFFLFFI